MRLTMKKFFIAASLTLVSLPLQSQDQTNTPPGDQPNAEILQFKDWAVRCAQRDTETKRSCVLFQRIALDSGQTVLSVTAAYPADSDEAAAVFRLPLGIFLPAGAAMQVDDSEQINLVIQRCDQRGCWASLKLDEKTLGLFKKGRQGRVGFNNTAGKTIAVPLSLKGFTAGFNQISKDRK